MANAIDHQRVINFAAGPAKLPEEVLLTAQREMMNYSGLGVSIMELSHRSAEFGKIMNKVEQDYRDLLDIPDNYKVLFLPGGGTGQFSAVPMNILNGGTADYIVTGSWSAKALKEAQKYGKVQEVFKKPKAYTGIPSHDTWNLNPDAKYLYYCNNETVHGVEFQQTPYTLPNVPLVCDSSSNMLSRPIDVAKHGLIYAGAQKNMGCAGVTAVIVREDLVGTSIPECPIILDYKTQVGMNSLYNTPPVYSIYIMGLVFEWVKKQGGVKVMEERSIKKSNLLYDVIDNSENFYCCPVDVSARSRMNITYRIGGPGGNEELEKKFVEEAKKQGMVSLKGHRSVGGIRASLYNATTIEETMKLAEFMSEFKDRYFSLM
ncbi:phosphoserine aminotransferase-like [Antedon mediterranea]|uniref:phosphoserine aminotransferase-like n=1 Tax=Antedon mediterranea TaxID=105859 RepID=UPI003AF6C342